MKVTSLVHHCAKCEHTHLDGGQSRFEAGQGLKSTKLPTTFHPEQVFLEEDGA